MRRISVDRFDVPVVSGLLLLHLGAVAALFAFSWLGLVLFFGLYWLTTSLGISLAFHRMLSHKSLRPRPWVGWGLVLLGCLAFQGRPFEWVGVHRLHHADPDGDKDPHTPRHGLGWAHWGWLLRRNTGGARREQVIPDLKRQPALVWLNRWCPAFQMASLGALWAVGALGEHAGLQTSGLSCVLWGGAARIVASYHATWCVNSAAHTWGYINYRTRDTARNLWWVGLLTYGEGWHNNHHAHPASARIGWRWFELDVTWFTIRVLQAMRLVSDVKLPRLGSNPDRQLQAG